MRSVCGVKSGLSSCAVSVSAVHWKCGSITCSVSPIPKGMLSVRRRRVRTSICAEKRFRLENDCSLDWYSVPWYAISGFTSSASQKRIG